MKDYDYSQSGAYFITICTKDKESLFGEIHDREMILNAAGEMVEKWWFELMNKFPSVMNDAYVIMPNHMHGIIVIVGADLCVCPENQNDQTYTLTGRDAHIGAPLYRMMQWFKTMTTNEYVRGVKLHSWPPFNCKLWQRNYYEHVIRNETEMNTLHEYIMNNPLNWLDDENYTRTT